MSYLPSVEYQGTPGEIGFKMIRAEDEILEIIKSAVREVIGKPQLELQGQTKLIADLGLESIDFVDVIFEIEQKIKIEIDLNLFASSLSRQTGANFNDFTVQDLVHFISPLQSRPGL